VQVRRRCFQHIFRREGVKAVVVNGDAFHRYDRNEMRVQRAQAQKNGQMHFSRFGPETTLFEELEMLFRVYGQSGTGKLRKYLHDVALARRSYGHDGLMSASLAHS
jgi:phosphoribulokinase